MADDDATQKKDFFISYNKADRTWAEWIAWQLEDSGKYSVVIQAWDFGPGCNFVLEMDRAIKESLKDAARADAANDAQSATAAEGRLPSIDVLVVDSRGNNDTDGILVTQVVPPIDSSATAVLKYHAALKKYHPSATATFVSLEGYLADRLGELRARHGNAPLERFDQCLDILLRKRRVYRPSPSFLYFPQLPAVEFHDRALVTNKDEDEPTFAVGDQD